MIIKQVRVDSVRKLDANESYDKPLTSVSLEGLSVLLRDPLPVPPVGVLIAARVESQWKERDNGKKYPIHWLKQWQEVPLI